MIIKSLIAVVILWFLFKSGKLDFRILADSLKHPFIWLASLVLISSQIVVATMRWRLFLHYRSEGKLSFWYILKLQWIGQLFNTILPGAVSGDLVKLYYARTIDPRLSKTFLLITIFIDRMIGLCGLLLLSGIFSAINYSELAAISPKLKTLAHFNYLITLGIILFILSIFLPRRLRSLSLFLAKKVPYLGRQISKTLIQIWIMGKSKTVILSTLFLSMLSQMLGITAFWILSAPYFSGNVHVPIKFAFTFIPLGLVTVAIPITPSGLGVGHAAFDHLFGYFGVNNGASLFNFYFISVSLVNLFGIIPYIFSSYKFQK